MKENIIIVGDYNRNDFLYVARVMHEHYNIYFLEYTHKAEIKSDQYKKWGKAIFWGDYKNAIDLVDNINPKLVVFYFIESFNHVALNVSCKYKGVRTYHIEHGIRSYDNLKINNKIISKKKSAIHQIISKFNGVRSRLKGRLFFQKTVERLPEVYSLFLKEYFRVRSSKNIFETFCTIKSLLRVADCYISFSKKIFEFHQKNDHLPDGYPMHFIGCPSFDYLADNILNQFPKKNILFIDNPFELQNLFGWNEENKIQFLNKLIDFAAKQNKKLWIKPHPNSKKRVYEESGKSRHTKLIEDSKNFIEAINDSKVIIGFYSTLLMPFMAMDHTVCFSLEMHPFPTKEGLSSFLVDTGATKRIDSWEQLALSFENLETISYEQKKHKQQFIDDWLYKFDGKSTERLRTILMGDEAA